MTIVQTVLSSQSQEVAVCIRKSTTTRLLHPTVGLPHSAPRKTNCLKETIQWMKSKGFQGKDLLIIESKAFQV